MPNNMYVRKHEFMAPPKYFTLQNHKISQLGTLFFFANLPIYAESV